MSNVIDFTDRMINRNKKVLVDDGVGQLIDSSEININNVLFGVMYRGGDLEFMVNPHIVNNLTNEQLIELMEKLTEALAVVPL